MPTQEIPEAWRKDVCAVLKTDAPKREIEWTIDARTRYETDFFVAFPDDLYPVLGKLFHGPPAPMGCPKKMNHPAGETYEFFFQFKKKKGYGKVLLHADRKKITIFSAHLPSKDKLSCE